MTLRVTLCDDSGMARKQLFRALPDDWDAQVSMAEHGEQALERVRSGAAEVLFLDLNMPVLDGYETLERIAAEQLDTFVIVVSGDIQPAAQQRVKRLGAMAFVKKPMSAGEVTNLLSTFGLYTPAGGQLQQVDESSKLTASQHKRDTYQEIANVAMGRAGDFLARILNVFIDLPIPNVNELAPSELHMALATIDQDSRVSAVSQGFAGGGMHGEALVIFTDSSMHDMAKLLNYDAVNAPVQQELEALMDIAALLTSACLKGLTEQLHVQFSPGQPILLGQHQQLRELLQISTAQESAGEEDNRPPLLAIEIGYSIKSHNINFDLLLLFPPMAIPALDRQLAHVLEASA